VGASAPTVIKISIMWFFLLVLVIALIVAFFKNYIFATNESDSNNEKQDVYFEQNENKIDILKQMVENNYTDTKLVNEERKIKYDFGELTVWGIGLIASFFTGCSIDIFNKSFIYIIFYLVVSTFSLYLFAREMIKKYKEPEIFLYEIHNFELNFLNTVLENEKEDIDIVGLLKDINTKR
jgi:hypothetical protein